MIKKRIIYFAPVCEWNDYVGFNAFLHNLRKEQEIEDLVVVVPNKAKSIITEADSYITLSDKEADESDSNYPAVLETLNLKQISIGNKSFTTHGRNKSQLFELAYKFIRDSDEYNDYEVIFYEEEVNLYGQNIVQLYRDTFLGLRRLIQDRVCVKPSDEDIKRVKKDFSNYFLNGGKYYMLMTRNFERKAVEENTRNILPNLREALEKIVDSGINIINVGFPVQNYDINSPNYFEISNPKLTQEELVALMYCCDGVLMSGRSGGFAAHVLSNVDIFMIYPEWSMLNKDLQIEVFETRAKSNQEVVSCDLSDYFSIGDFESIIKLLKNHNKKSKNLVSKPKKTITLHANKV